MKIRLYGIQIKIMKNVLLVGTDLSNVTNMTCRVKWKLNLNTNIKASSLFKIFYLSLLKYIK